MDKGKKTEAVVAAWMESRSRFVATFSWHRFPDARAARNAIAAQPSDFFVANDGKVMLWEVKETQAGRLPRSKVTQWPMLRKYWWAGVQPVVIVYQTVTDKWHLLDAADLFDHAETPTSFPLTNPFKTFDHVENALNTALQLFVQPIIK